MDDLISRQAAIDALVKAIREDPYYDSNKAINGLGVCDVRVVLNDLPSAQPDIIRCRDCAKSQYDTLFDKYWCNGREVRQDFYCGDAVRKEN